MKKRIVALMMVCVAMVVTACNSEADTVNSDNKYKKTTVRIATNTGEQSIDTMAAYYFADLVESASNGQITVNVFPNAQLAGGSQPKSLELLIAGGSYDLAVFSGSVLGNVDERFLTHSIPFIFDSYEEVTEYLDGSGGEYYKKLMDEKGLVYLAAEHNGLRQLTNNRKEIKKPSDLKGLKIRIPSGEVYMKTMSAFGADAVAMNWSEVFTAMQQGTIDGHENGYQTIVSSNIQEVQKYITEWNWSYDGWWFMSNKRDWSRFDEATKKLLEEKAEESCQWGRKKLIENEEIIKKDFEENYGVTITYLTDEELKGFVETVRPVQEYFIKKFGKEACAAWGLE